MIPRVPDGPDDAFAVGAAVQVMEKSGAELGDLAKAPLPVRGRGSI